ncbi:MAG: SIS domain-containing protein [Phycisphaerae bacterium]
MLSDESKRSLIQAGRDLTNRVSRSMEQADWDGLLQLADRVPRAKRTFVTGAGRSGLVARNFGMRLMHLGLTAFIPGETITPAADAGDLLVAISCTGKTGYTDFLARKAHQAGAQVVVLTSNAESQLAADADLVVTIPTSSEDIVVRAAVFEHAASLCLDAVFNVLAERLKLDIEAFQKRHANLE